jgi:single-strand DNA-binding protein
MASGVNKVILVGNLGKDPEVRYVQSGNAVCTLRLAVTERRKDGDNWKDHTEWMDVVTFGKTAENAGQYLQKGRQIYVEGRLQTRQWDDKDGNKRYTTEIRGDRIVLLGGGGGGMGARSQTRTPVAAAAGGDHMEPMGEPINELSDDDIPF